MSLYGPTFRATRYYRLFYYNANHIYLVSCLVEINSSPEEQIVLVNFDSRKHASELITKSQFLCLPNNVHYYYYHIKIALRRPGIFTLATGGILCRRDTMLSVH